MDVPGFEERGKLGRRYGEIRNLCTNQHIKNAHSLHPHLCAAPTNPPPHVLENTFCAEEGRPGDGLACQNWQLNRCARDVCRRL
ncbi:hypothetical protein GCM10011408_08160 [Dyella caseinilytica]|nr:hypothetical protein GCM10011408_08160 [Dyella caseinilytica]